MLISTSKPLVSNLGGLETIGCGNILFKFLADLKFTGSSNNFNVGIPNEVRASLERTSLPTSQFREMQSTASSL